MMWVTQAPYFIFYDGHCRICTRSKRVIERMAPPSADLRFVDIKDAAALAPFPMVDPAATRAQIFVLAPGGQLRGGYDGLVSLMPALGNWGWLESLARSRPVAAVGRLIYRWIAANRYRIGGGVSCEDGACRL